MRTSRTPRTGLFYARQSATPTHSSTETDKKTGKTFSSWSVAAVFRIVIAWRWQIFCVTRDFMRITAALWSCCCRGRPCCTAWARLANCTVFALTHELITCYHKMVTLCRVHGPRGLYGRSADETRTHTSHFFPPICIILDFMNDRQHNFFLATSENHEVCFSFKRTCFCQKVAPCGGHVLMSELKPWFFLQAGLKDQHVYSERKMAEVKFMTKSGSALYLMTDEEVRHGFWKTKWDGGRVANRCGPCVVHQKRNL